MPDVFNRIGQPRWWEGARRLLGIDGPQGMPTLSPELVPVALVVPDGIEAAALRQERLAIGGTFIGAGGIGTTQKMFLTNPAGSGVLVIVEWVHWGAETGTLATPEIRVGTGATGSLQAVTSWRDGRWGFASTRVPSATFRTLVDASTQGVRVHIQNLQAGETQWWPLGFVLAPGDQIHIRNASANTGFSTTYLWRERVVLPGELTV